MSAYVQWVLRNISISSMCWSLFCPNQSGYSVFVSSRQLLNLNADESMRRWLESLVPNGDNKLRGGFFYGDYFNKKGQTNSLTFLGIKRSTVSVHPWSQEHLYLIRVPAGL